MNHRARRWAMMALVAMLAMALAAPAGLAAALPRAITRATALRIESSAGLYVGRDGVGTKHTPKIEIKPASATANSDASLRYWTSDNTSVATVSSKGEITAHAVGTTYVNLHLEDGSGLGARCKVTVKRQTVTAIKLNHTRVQRLPGTTYQLKAALSPSNAYPTDVVWSSSDKSIAKVNQSGFVKCYKPGMVQIYCKAKTGGAKASCTFVVGYDFNQSHFRIITIANWQYPDVIGPIPAMEHGAREIYNAYRDMLDAGVAKVNKGYKNQTGAQIRKILSEMVGNKNTTENDVTVFVFAGRGEMSTDGGNKGALLGVDANKSAGLVTIAEIQAQLDKIPGMVVLILDSHMAGQFIASKAATDRSAADFNQQVINQFRTSTATNFNPKAIGGAHRTKYKIFTSCAALGRPYGVWDEQAGEGFSFFSRSLAEVLTSGGDHNRDGVITLREAVHYTTKKVNSYIKRFNKEYNRSVSQKVSVWPTNDYSPIYVVSGSGGDDDDEWEEIDDDASGADDDFVSGGGSEW